MKGSRIKHILSGAYTGFLFIRKEIKAQIKQRFSPSNVKRNWPNILQGALRIQGVRTDQPISGTCHDFLVRTPLKPPWNVRGPMCNKSLGPPLRKKKLYPPLCLRNLHAQSQDPEAQSSLPKIKLLIIHVYLIINKNGL